MRPALLTKQKDNSYIYLTGYSFHKSYIVSSIYAGFFIFQR
jgi:hypothetical protein